MTTVEGTVEARNDRGIRISGEWLNVSRFRPVDLPAPGASVRCDVDHKGFLASVETLDQPAEPGRNQTITRLAVLKAAVTFAAARPDLRSVDVLRLAEAFEDWTLRA